jgi:hypothetical protein
MFLAVFVVIGKLKCGTHQNMDEKKQQQQKEIYVDGKLFTWLFVLRAQLRLLLALLIVEPPSSMASISLCSLIQQRRSGTLSQLFCYVLTIHHNFPFVFN